MFRFFGAFFWESKRLWGASAQAPTGCYFRALRRSNRAASVSAFGTPPRSPPPGIRPPSGLRGSTHSARRSDSTRRHTSARFASAETVQPRSVCTLRRECSTGRRPSIVLRFTADDTRQRNRGMHRFSFKFAQGKKNRYNDIKPCGAALAGDFADCPRSSADVPRGESHS